MNHLAIKLATAVLLLSGCVANDQNKENTSPLIAAVAQIKISDDSTLENLKIYCYACHNPAVASHDDVIAPPLAAIKMRYAMKYSSRETFSAAMSNFLLEPSEQDAIMYNAVKRFGLMAKTPADEETIRSIVEYIADHEVDEPSWFRKQMVQENMLKE